MQAFGPVTAFPAARCAGVHKRPDRAAGSCFLSFSEVCNLAIRSNAYATEQ